jgi:hypothetical protein
VLPSFETRKNCLFAVFLRNSALSWRPSKRGKTPGTQMQHTLVIRMIGTEFRHFLASDYGTIWASTKYARGFAPIARPRPHSINLRLSARFYPRRRRPAREWLWSNRHRSFDSARENKAMRPQDHLKRDASNRGKSVGTQVQHTLAIRTIGTEFRHSLTSNCGTIWANTKSARTFAPLTRKRA